MTEITDPKQVRWLAAAMFAIALYCIYNGLITTPESHTPSWIAYVLSIMFAAAGLAMLNRTAGDDENNGLLAFVILLCMGIVFAWVPFGGHPEDCHSTSGFLFWSHTSSGGSSYNRVFGFAGWVMIGVAVIIAVRWVRSLLDD